MKLTFKQRIIALFTGRVGEKSADTVDASTVKPTPIMPPKAVVIPERKRATATAASTEPKRRKPRHSKYAEQAKACRMHPECWQQVATTPVRSTANALVSKIRHGGLPAFHKPRGGHYEARASLCMGMRLVEARFMPNNKKGQTK
ncbi:hypothetical protein CJ214_00515 [Peptoniphilus lacrimalis]|nr:hypothetical protein CJ214_00515 [Peptoniphilus lacrimalis]